MAYNGYYDGENALQKALGYQDTRGRIKDRERIAIAREEEIIRRKQYDDEILRQRQEALRQNEAQTRQQNALQSFQSDLMARGNQQPNTMGPMPGGGQPLSNREDAIRSAGEYGFGMDAMPAINSLFPSPKEPNEGTMTDIWRYAGLAEQQWNRDNPGIPMPPDEKMQAMMAIKRATPSEAGAVRGAQLGADLAYKPVIAGRVEGAKAGVKIDTGAGIKEASKTGELTAVNNMDIYKSANASVANIEKIDELITQIESSEAITGFGAELFKNVERVKAKIGSDVAAGKVTDTEILNAMMGSEVFPLIKALGIGARGMDTPAERKFLQEVMTGAIDLNKSTVLRMAKMRRSLAERTIKRYNTRVDSGSLNNFFKHSGITKSRIEMNPATNEIKTQQEYDRLPSGAIYMEDGQQYRKP